MLAGGSDEPGDAPKELRGGEEPVGVAVAARLAQGEGDTAVGRQGDLVVGEGGPQGVANEAMAALVVAGLDAQVGVHVDAIDIDEARTEERWTRDGTAEQGLAVLVEGARGES